MSLVEPQWTPADLSTILLPLHFLNSFRPAVRQALPFLACEHCGFSCWRPINNTFIPINNTFIKLFLVKHVLWETGKMAAPEISSTSGLLCAWSNDSSKIVFLLFQPFLLLVPRNFKIWFSWLISHSLFTITKRSSSAFHTVYSPYLKFSLLMRPFLWRGLEFFHLYFLKIQEHDHIFTI